MVTINSTSGLSGLIHNMPVKVLGRAYYDIPGMTDQNTLAEFWNHPTPPDKELFHAYRMYHLNVTQINGNFYSQVFSPTKTPPTLLHQQPDLVKEKFRPSENISDGLKQSIP